tara:strand:+ start:2098 stop:4983 length:2886 start_codon:yes stop_codon:yes gene_type:complete
MAAPTNYVIKVYSTEAHAIEGGTTNALAVTGGSSGNENMVSQDAQSTYNFHTHERYYYRIEANGPIKSIYIDWDDGEDNDPKSKANFQYVQSKTGEDFVVVDHIYTEHKIFFPLIKAVNLEGFESKYYTPSFGAGSSIAQQITITCAADTNGSLDGKYFHIYDGNNQKYKVWFDNDTDSGTAMNVPSGVTSVEITDVTDGDPNTDVAIRVAAAINALSEFSTSRSNEVVTVTNATAGNASAPDAGTSGFTMATTVFGAKNDYSTLESEVTGARDPKRMVEVDSNTAARIPSFMPAAVPPVAILKTNRTEVFAGIDNTKISGITEPRGYAYIDGEDANNEATNLATRTADVNISNLITVIYEDTLGNINTETIEASTAINHDPAKFGTSNGISKLLEVRVNNLLEADSSNLSRLFSNEKVHILCFANGNTNNDPVAPIGNETTASTSTVTLCQVSLGNPIVTLDSPENTVIADGGESYSRHSNEEINQYIFDTSKLSQGNTVANVDDVTQVSPVLSVTASEQPIEKISYTFDIFEGDQRDLSYNKFATTERLIRLQVRQNSDDNAMTTGDTKNFSFLDHFNYTNFADPTADVPEYLSTKNMMLFFSEKGGGSPEDTWTDVGLANNLTNNTNVFGSSTTGNALSLVSTTPIGTTAENFLLMLNRDKKFNKIYFRMDNEARYGTIAGGDDRYQLQLNLAYTSPTGWKPLPFRDTTVPSLPSADAAGYGKRFSLQTSGSLTFDMPTDWVQLIHDEAEVSNGVFQGDEASDDGTTISPNDLWTFPAYGLKLTIDVPEATNTTTECIRVHAYDNEFSQLIKVKDPMCISMNDLGVSQNISYKRNGRYIELDDRLGRREIRRIGAAGGRIRFGGVDLKGDSFRETIISHQKRGERVYYDFKRPDGSFIRFYGIIITVSEDLPVGLQHPKVGIDFSVEYIIEFTSAGAWVRKQSLGGDVIDEPRFSIQT